MTNPYESHPNPSAPNSARRHVRRYVSVGLASLTLGCMIGLPAVFLLNQQWQWIPTRFVIMSMDFNGREFDSRTIITHCLVYAGTLIFVATILFGLAFRNLRNRSKQIDTRP